MNLEIYKADTLIDGSGADPRSDVEIHVRDGVIEDIVPIETKDYPSDATVYSNPGKTVVPGLIDVHVHLMFGSGRRTYEDVIEHDSDDLMIMRGIRNAYLHLRAGVTTMRDMAARSSVGFTLREGAEAGLFLSPRLHVCGRPLTITGGHFWWCNEEADGVDQVRRSTRKLLKEGADFIKIMASGGGTKGTDASRASYTVAEMAAAVVEAHQVGKKLAAHCLSADSVERTVDAGVDQIEHFNFMLPDGSRVFNENVAEKIVERGIYLSPTIQTGYRQIERLQNQTALTPAEKKQLDGNLYKLETKLEFIRRFHDMGAPIAAGTDAIQVFGDYAIGLELLHRAGLSNMDVLVAATSRAAKAMGIEENVGALRPGMAADFVYLDGNPLADVKAFRHVDAVVLDGRLVVDKRLDFARGIPALADGAVLGSPVYAD